MFKNMEEFVIEGVALNRDTDGVLSSRELKICTAALLFDIAYADKVLESAEIEMVFRLLEEQFEVRGAKAGDIAEVGRVLAKDRTRLQAVLEVVNEQFSVEQRQTIAGLLFAVMQADGQAEQEEARRVSELGKKLGLSAEQVAHARKLSETSE